MATRVKVMSTVSITATAKKNSTTCMATSGPNAKSSWIDRMSVLARLMTWPDWVRSQKSNESSVSRSYIRLRRSFSMRSAERKSPNR